MTEIKIPDLSTLRRIKVISHFSEGHLIAVANQSRVLKAKKKQLLIKTGSTEKTSLYIVKGSVSLRARDGKTKAITVDENQELFPIAQLRPCIYDVIALGPVEYMKIDVERLIEISELSASELGDISVHSLFTDYDEEDNSIVNHLYRNLMDNSIKLPSLPSVAERIQRIYKGKATDVDAMVHILISYPDISRKLKNVARCADNDKLNATGKIRYAIQHLGMLPVYCLIMTYAVGKLVKRMPDNHSQRTASFWQHSLNVAAISRILAKKTCAFPPDLAMLAGLIHGIGVLVIDDRLLERNTLMLDHLEIDHAIQVMRPEISSLLLRKWNFADVLIQMVEECGDWTRDHEGPADLCDLVLVANYCGMLQGDIDHSLPLVSSIPAMEKLGITSEVSIDAIRESAVVKRNIKKLFV
ncbi:MAG: HDOD domain-containing protein [Gammaproteobacteria bacterium]|nr:HDOD domain-containing protein [Gammaproteobacteria bacterium]